MTRLDLSLAMGDYDRTRPIADGRVQIDGVRPIPLLLSPEEMFFNAFRHHSYDIAELSLSSYALSLTRPDPPYVAVPVFLSRAFRHSSVYIRSDRGIAGPQDLRGRRVGIAEYQLSANVWVRAILAEEGIPPEAIDWRRGGMDTPGRPEKLALTLPDAVRLTPLAEGETLNGLLASGGIDAFIGPRAPRPFAEGHPQVARLWPDGRAAEAWFARHGIFPIMHVLGLRRSLAEAHPWLPVALLKAFEAARRMALAALSDTSATKATMPFVEESLARAAALSADLWSYGLGAGNRAALDYFLDAHHAQGLSPRRVAVDEMFHPATHERFSL